MNTLLQDIRYAIRALRRAPGFTAIAALTLALGIGANTTIFSAVNALLLKPLPFPDREQLIELRHVDSNGETSDQTSAANFLALRERSPELQSLAAFSWWDVNLGGIEGAERLTGFSASPDFFSTLGVHPVLGRTFATDEGTPGRDRVVVLSHRLWMRRYNADPAVIGQTVMLNGNPHTVVGVLPRDMAFPPHGDVWRPREFDAAWGRSVGVVGRLRPGATPEQAQAALSARLRQLVGEQPGTYTGAGMVVQPLYADQTSYLSTLLGILMAAVGFVLLIACANVTSLLLARATAREREIAIRTALGAGRGRIIRQLLVESAMLGLAGGVLGAVLAFWGVDLLKQSIPNHLGRFLSGWDALVVDARVLVFTLVVSVGAGVLFGLAPALGASRLELTDALKDGGGGGSGKRGGKLRRTLVVGEVALALVLLTGAGLMTRSFLGLVSADPGFRSEGVLTVQVSLPPSPDAGARNAAFFGELLQRVRQQPGVSSSGLVEFLPLSRSGAGTRFTVAGRPTPPGQEPWTQYRTSTPGYLETLGIPLLRGRTFSEQDAADVGRAVLINSTLARRYWGDQEPVGQRIQVWGQEHEIVGVVSDVHHFGLDEAPAPELYLPHAQNPAGDMFLAIRTGGDPAQLAATIRREIAALNPDAAVGEVRTMDRVRAEFTAPERLMAGLLGAFALVALVIAAIGVYGVMAYAVSQRTREIGVRLALGAQMSDVLRLVVGQGMVLAATGLVLGLAAAFGLTRFLRSLLYGVEPADPATFVTVVLLLAVSALIAVYVPARRAARLNPLVAIRAE